MKKIILKDKSGTGLLPVTDASLVNYTAVHKSDGEPAPGKLSEELAYLYARVISLSAELETLKATVNNTENLDTYIVDTSRQIATVNGKPISTYLGDVTISDPDIESLITTYISE